MLSLRYLLFPILVIPLILSGCAPDRSAINSSPAAIIPDISSTPVIANTPEPATQAGLPNPASMYCEQQGGRLEIRSDAEGNQSGVCLFEDGSECDEWAFFRGECAPGLAQEDAAPTGSPRGTNGRYGIPRYTNVRYGFSFDPPASWAIEDKTDYLLFTRPGYKMFIGYQWADEDPKPFRTGMPQGDFVDGGTASLLGQAVPKQILVFEGKNKVVAYGGRIEIGNLILVMYLDAVESDTVSYQDLDIPQEIIDEADQIIASFALNSGEKPELEFNP